MPSRLGANLSLFVRLLGHTLVGIHELADLLSFFRRDKVFQEYISGCIGTGRLCFFKCGLVIQVENGLDSAGNGFRVAHIREIQSDFIFEGISHQEAAKTIVDLSTFGENGFGNKSPFFAIIQLRLWLVCWSEYEPSAQ